MSNRKKPNIGAWKKTLQNIRKKHPKLTYKEQLRKASNAYKVTKACKKTKKAMIRVKQSKNYNTCRTKFTDEQIMNIVTKGMRKKKN